MKKEAKKLINFKFLNKKDLKLRYHNSECGSSPPIDGLSVLECGLSSSVLEPLVSGLKFGSFALSSTFKLSLLSLTSSDLFSSLVSSSFTSSTFSLSSDVVLFLSFSPSDYSQKRKLLNIKIKIFKKFIKY
jgi:hypothetical protein